jgi:hypothetical protein
VNHHALRLKKKTEVALRGAAAAFHTPQYGVLKNMQAKFKLYATPQ